jgi:hypothetical protein
VFRRVSQHAQGAQDDEAMVPSLVSGITVIDEEYVGGLFQRQGKSGSLARSESGTPYSNGLRRCLDNQPLRAREPLTDDVGSLLAGELLNDGRRHQDTPVERRQVPDAASHASCVEPACWRPGCRRDPVSQKMPFRGA